MRLLLLSPQCDSHDVGESQNAYRWIKHLGEVCDVTLLTLRWPGEIPPSEQLTGIRVVEWDTFPSTPGSKLMRGKIKAWFPHYYFKTKQWIRDALKNGERFDIAHQLSPFAPRFPSSLARFDIPYVIGPISGGLPTPEGFLEECNESAWYSYVRSLDSRRIQIDPWLRRSYERADVVLGTAAYTKSLLSGLSIQRFEPLLHIGIADLPQPPAIRQREAGELRMVYVGRVVRTKGLRDSIRALGILRKEPALNLKLDVIGSGGDLPACEQAASELGVSDQVTFHGAQPREAVEEFYANADVLVFPSFREPAGNVVLEALRHGLPVITTNVGGPGYMVDDSCGIRIRAETPDQLAEDLASAIRKCALDVQMTASFSKAAVTRASSLGGWPSKVTRLKKIYEEVIENHGLERQVPPAD